MPEGEGGLERIGEVTSPTESTKSSKSEIKFFRLR